MPTQSLTYCNKERFTQNQERPTQGKTDTHLKMKINTIQRRINKKYRKIDTNKQRIKEHKIEKD